MAIDVVNCLDFNVFKAERLSAIEVEPLTADILDDSVLLDAPDGSIELNVRAAQQCVQLHRLGARQLH